MDVPLVFDMELSGWSAAERRAAADMLKTVQPEQRQVMLDELISTLRAQDVKVPLKYLRVMADNAKDFQPAGAAGIAAERAKRQKNENARKSAERRSERQIKAEESKRKGETEKTAENGYKGENQPGWKAGRTQLSKLKEEIKK